MRFTPRSFAWIAAIYSLLSSTAATAGPGRTAVKKVPTIQGREIEQFVLVDYLRINAATNAGGSSASAFVMLPGQFVAVSEDSGGVYYQPVSGFRRAHDPSDVAAGGVYVSRTGKYAMRAYLGDARDPSAAVNQLHHHPMAVDDMRKFQVAKSAAAKALKK